MPLARGSSALPSVLLEIDSVCVRFGFTRNGFSVSGLVLLEKDSVCQV